ncbi:hypothetical protein BJ138DRAFT_164175 [Hygrophoropsis aurantiaca]|uniref:Uncharacterized protein n=1 Tax=Hygrophoropsis aurantiaca TaxID=72124 RepID=A0ACB7ZQ57_9AGAM|nr:hypothetical protein BJ138DRAFT_164175 [Hygrophoropsis aurantiaca]
MDGRMILPPISISPGAEILDSGVGSATWLMDCCKQLPSSCQFYGIDIKSKVFPDTSMDTLSNLHLSVASVTALPQNWADKFILVNQRLLMAGLTLKNWKLALEEIYRVLECGGFVQLLKSDSDSVQSGPETTAGAKLLHHIMVTNGLNPECSKAIGEMLIAGGF